MAGVRDLSTRARLAVVGVVVVVVAAVLVVLLASAGDDDSSPTADESAPTSAPTGTPATDSPTGTASPPAPTTGPTEAPTPIPTRPPVALDEPADFGDGVTAEIVDIQSVQGEGQGIGEISGPSLVVRLRLTNDTDAPLPIDQATVNLAYGADGDPAAPLFGDERSRPFSGTVAAGESAGARYVFNVPERQRGEVQVTISHAALSPVVAFEGAAS